MFSREWLVQLPDNNRVYFHVERKTIEANRWSLAKR